MRAEARTLGTAAFLAGVLAASSSPAQEQAGRWRFGAEVGTDFPLQVGAGLHVESPQRIRLHTSLGVLPGAYLDAINAVAVEAGWYDDPTARLIKAALDQALIWRLRAGWRPFASYGFYFSAGYSLGALGGGLGAAQALAIAAGGDASTLPEGREFKLASQVHMLDVEAGWEWLFFDALVLRAAVGGAFTVASSTNAEPNWQVRPAFEGAVNALAQAGEDYLDDTIESYVHTPTISLMVGYRY